MFLLFFSLRKLATQLRRVGLNIYTERQSCMAADKLYRARMFGYNETRHLFIYTGEKPHN